jgi:pSer/pThr/pTyr-binding forkhead associated (FHA) protein
MSGPVVLALRLFLAISLYAFLGWAFFSLWKEIKQQGSLLASRKVPSISLAVDRGELAPQVWHFAQPEITIGRDPACECPVDDASISARHACLSFHHNQWWLEDLNSSNGTFLNGEKLTMPTVVISEDQFKCGGTNFTITLRGGIFMSSTKRI